MCIRDRFDTAYTGQIYPFHIIIITTVEPVGQIAVFSAIESVADFFEFFFTHFRVEAVYLEFKTDASLFRIIFLSLVEKKLIRNLLCKMSSLTCFP